MVNHGFSVFVHLYRTDGAGTHARTHDLTDGTEGTNLLAASTFDTHFLIDVCSVVHNGDGVSRTVFLTFMPQTAAAGIADHKTVNGTFVTRGIQHVNDAVALCRLQHQTHTIFNNMAFLIDAAAEGCLRPGNNRFCNLLFHIDFLIQLPIEEAARALLVYQILDVLYITFKLAHNLHLFFSYTLHNKSACPFS